MGWAVVVTQASREELAERSIAALGYATAFLWYRRLIRDRQTIVNGHKLRQANAIVRRPLFRGYGFVLLPYEADACDIDAAFGVARLLRHTPLEGDRIGRPKRVRASIVEQLRSACEAQEFDDPELRPKPKLRDDLKPGDVVRDPATGLVGVLLMMDERNRALFLARLLGREVQTRVDDANTLELVG